MRSSSILPEPQYTNRKPTNQFVRNYFTGTKKKKTHSPQNQRQEKKKKQPRKKSPHEIPEA